MKTLLTSTAIALALSLTPAAAQQVVPLDPAATATMDLVGERLFFAARELEPDADMLSDWEDVGEISEVVLTPEGEVDVILAEVGGFLGLGERTIAIDPSRLAMIGTPDDFLVVARADRAEVEGAEAYVATSDTPFVMGRTDHVEAIDYEGTGQTTAGGVDVVTNREGAPVTPMNDQEIEGTTTNVAVLDEGTVVDNPQTPATAVITAQGAQTTTVGDGTPEGADGLIIEEARRDNGTVTVNGDVVVAETGSNETTPMDGDREMAVTDGVVTEGTDGIIADADVAMAPVVDRDGYTGVLHNELALPEIEGVDVFGVNDEAIGEIGYTVNAAASGMGHPLAILEIGGFLGLGEHRVAVPMPSLTFLRGADGDLRAYIDASEEQLEGLPEYEG